MPNIPPRYFSTNAGIFGTSELEKDIAAGKIRTVGLAEAIITGQAPDSGLFMPTHFPQVDLETIARMKGMDYAHVFVESMQPFFEGTLPRDTLESIANEAYPEKDKKSAFRPFIEGLSEVDFVGRLDEGPTFAFKDYAAQVLFRIIEAVMSQDKAAVKKLSADLERKYRNAKSLGNPGLAYAAALPANMEMDMAFRDRLNYIDMMAFITATSGDTGGAMGHAILNRKKMWMAIIHSASLKDQNDVQAKQMDTLGGNTYAIWAKTDFDGCQKIAQQLQSDPDLKYMNLNSANSINIGRLLPQIAYYFYIYSRVAERAGEEVVISVPSGNFGNAVAGLFAIRMGLPIKLLVGVNENDVFERFYRTDFRIGSYAPAAQTVSTPSNAMDINWPSNMRRLFQLYGGQLIEGTDPENPERKIVKSLVLPGQDALKQEILGAYSLSSSQTRAAIKEFWDKGYRIGEVHSTLEPHGAVAWGAAQRFRQQTCYSGKIVALETAHPAKFPESLLDLEIKPGLPSALYRLINLPHGRHYELDDYASIKAHIMQFHSQELARHHK